ncbi:hypothetical protein BC833DRAFT_4336 [Globomyces pollinis-pini]|nr:hypothetical protein BC833DRAFT_4336 [Globomyces pollinis-pini]
MILILAPHVKVQYTFKFPWILDSDESNPLIQFQPTNKSIRVELNVLAHHSFAILFINVHNYDTGKGDSVSNALHDKLAHLHSVLKQVSESDETLQIISDFNSEGGLELADHIIAGSSGPTYPSSLPTNYWQYLSHTISVKPHLLDTWKSTLILRSTSSQTNFGDRAARTLFSNPEVNRRYQVATIYLSRFLTSWASFSITKTSYMKWIYSPVQPDAIPIGFCSLHLKFETESFMKIHLRFFACPFEQKQSIIEDFTKGLEGIHHVNRTAATLMKPMYMCKKPIDTLIISYIMNEESEDEDQPSIYFQPNITFARFFLRHFRWNWFLDIQNIETLDTQPSPISRIMKASFISIYNARVKEGFLRVFESAGSVTFYKEVLLRNTLETPVWCGVQYIILWHPKAKILISELWVEPIRGSEQSIDESQEYFSEIEDQIHKTDLEAINAVFAFEYPTNRNIITLKELTSKPSSKNDIFVETKFHLPALLKGSNFFFTQFIGVGNDNLDQAKCGDQDTKMELVEDIFHSDYAYTCTAGMPLSESFVSETDIFSKLCLLNNEVEQIPTICIVNQVLIGFMRKHLSKLVDDFLYWHPSKESPELFAGLQSLIPQFVLPHINPSDVYFKFHSYEKLYIIIVPFIDPQTIMTNFKFNVIVIENSRPNTNHDTGQNECLKCNQFNISILSDITSKDGEIIIRGSQSLSNVSDSDTISTSSKKSTQDQETSDMIHLDIQDILSRAFGLSFAKTLYFSLLMGESLCKFDIDRTMIYLTKKRITIDITDFIYMNSLLYLEEQSLDFLSGVQLEYKQIIHRKLDFLPISDLGTETNLLFLNPLKSNPKFSTMSTEERCQSMIELSDKPLYISISCTLKQSESSCEKETPLIFSDFTSDEYTKNTLILPRLNTKQRADLHIDLYVLQLEGSSYMDSLSSEQYDSIKRLKEDFSILYEDQILLSLLSITDLHVGSMLLDYIQSILRKRHLETDPIIMNSMEIPDIVGNKNSYYFKAILKFFDPQCVAFFKEDLTKFNCLGIPLRQSGQCFFVMSDCSECDDNVSNKFCVTAVVQSNSIDLYLFCKSVSIDRKLQILRSMLDSIYKCVKRANQRFLLKELSITHLSRDAIDSHMLPVVKDATSDLNDSVLHQYACPLQFTRWFPILPRIRSVFVLNSILLALQVLAISNRKGILSFSSEFYIKIVESDEGSSPSNVVSKTDSQSISGDSKIQPRIYIYVYGLNTPGTEISVDFCRMIENKIEVLIQTALSTFLARNTSARLLKTDLDFVIPIEKGVQPIHQSTYLLVKELENPHLFIVLLRQALLLFLQPLVSNDIRPLLSKYYQDEYNQTVSFESQKHSINELQIGDLSFVYNCVPSRYISPNESAIGYGLASVILTPMDRENNILFPSTASPTLWNNRDVVLDNETFFAKHSTNSKESQSWDGYKIALSIWSNKGQIHLDALIEKIYSAFQHTLIDYTIESYYRSSEWHLLSSRNCLPDLKKETDIQCTSKEVPLFYKVMEKLPTVLKYGAERSNPVIQSITIDSSLPLNTISCGIRSVLSDEDLQAYFFVTSGDQIHLLEELSYSESTKVDDIDKTGKSFAIIGAVNIYVPIEPMPVDRRSSTVSDGSSNCWSPTTGPKAPTNIPLDNASEADSDGIASHRRDSTAKLSTHDFEEILMFPDSFYPLFPVYGKRSSFFVVSLQANSVSISTYNWKKSESDKFFLKLIKILNWAKINQQFISRKESYTGKQIAKFNENVSKFGSNVYKSSGSFASKFRELDFIYHIGGFEAVQLQSQIVDFLELFFRFGKQPTFQFPLQHKARDSSLDDASNSLSLKEMSDVLQSIQLIHSSSSPIFFSECRKDLLHKWENLVQSNAINTASLLSLGKSISSIEPALRNNEIKLEETWFKNMISTFLEKYVEYLEHLGMEKAKVDLSSHQSGRFGGAFAINPEVLIEAPSIFLRKFFPNGVILVQCGFYSYFATVNVLRFAYKTPTENTDHSDKEYDNECSNMTLFSHIVSFSYDFHLRYIQDILLQETLVDLPVDIIRVLRTFVSLNPRKARFCRNRIVRGFNNFRLETSELFRYMLKHPSLYGFKHILFLGKPVCLGLSLDKLTQLRKSDHSEFRYTLIICESENSVTVSSSNEKSFSLEYYVILVNKVNAYPHRELERASHISQTSDDDILGEYIEGGHYLRDVVALFECQIESLIEKALKDYGRDSLWSQLRDDSIQSDFEWSSLFLEKIAPELLDVTLSDPTLASFLSSPLPWDNIMTYLLQAYQKYAHSLTGSTNQFRHLVLFNSQNQDYLLYLRYNFQSQSMAMYSVSRAGVRDPIEHHHINDVVNSILYYLWT